MKKSNYPSIAIAFGVSVIAVGVPYWHLPYSQIALPNSLFGIGMLATIGAGVIIRAIGKAEFHETLLVIASVFVVVVLIRIVADLMTDSKTHNLWPFEVVISSLVGLIMGGIAAGIGNLVKSLCATSARNK